MSVFYPMRTTLSWASLKTMTSYQVTRLGVMRFGMGLTCLFVFDEVTRSGDAQSAALIAETVNQLRGNATVVFVAHKGPPNLAVDKHIQLAA